MKQFLVADLAQIAATDFSCPAGVSAWGEMRSRALIDGPDRPLRLWLHDMRPGARLDFRSPAEGHLVYVWEGGVVAGESELPARSAVTIEHGSSLAVTAGPRGAKVAHFHEVEPRRTRGGGQAHCVGPKGIFKGRRVETGQIYTIWADSMCERCELWLHGIEYPAGSPQGRPHLHTEDEIIFITEGSLKIGRLELTRGSALAVDSDITYSFGIGEAGLAFVNFRPCLPHHVTLNPDRSRNPVMNERDVLMAAQPM